MICTCEPGFDLALGCPVHDDVAIENARRLANVKAAGVVTVCGDVDAGEVLVLCECGKLRMETRICGYVHPYAGRGR